MAEEKKPKIVLGTGKRKTSVARTSIKEGSGKVTINDVLIDLYQPEYARLKIREALLLAGDLAKKVDIKVKARGGGTVSQSDAIRQSIAKGLVEFFKDENLKKAYQEYDRNFLVYDYRRTEPHKPSRSRKGARRYTQRSKR